MGGADGSGHGWRAGVGVSVFKMGCSLGERLGALPPEIPGARSPAKFVSVSLTPWLFRSYWQKLLRRPIETQAAELDREAIAAERLQAHLLPAQRRRPLNFHRSHGVP